jgi:hypothetical protein
VTNAVRDAHAGRVLAVDMHDDLLDPQRAFGQAFSAPRRSITAIPLR